MNGKSCLIPIVLSAPEDGLLLTSADDIAVNNDQ